MIPSPRQALYLFLVLSLAGSWVLGDEVLLDLPVPPGVRYCADLTLSEFECTDDPIATRQKADSLSLLKELTIGVPQRVDGTEAEQAAIREVIRQMRDYIFGEVLSKPDYANVRTACRNRNELCAFWAAIGECESNRIFMLPNCPAACRFCLLLHTNIGQPNQS